MHQVIWDLKINLITSESSNQMIRAKIDWLYPTVYAKDQVLGNVFGWTFLDSFRQNLSASTFFSSTFCQIWDFLPSCWGCLLTCGLKFVYPLIKLTFLAIIVKVKLPAKLCLHSFEWFCLEMNKAKYFFSLVQGIVSKINCCNIILFFKYGIKKEHIIISRVICSHMGPLYIETPCRKDDIIPFPFNEKLFSFFVADHLLVCQLCTNPKSDRSFLSCLKVTQYSTREIGDAPL